MQYQVWLDSEPGYKTVEADKIRCNDSMVVGLDSNDNVLWAVSIARVKWLVNA